ncbi:hypothetical protein TrCOL_g8089, partial [Triparma columacea]
ADRYGIPKEYIRKLGEALRLATQLYGVYVLKHLKELAKLANEFHVITSVHWLSIPFEFKEMLGLLLDMCQHVELVGGNKVIKKYTFDDLFTTPDPDKPRSQAYKACLADGSDQYLIITSRAFGNLLKLGGYRDAPRKANLALRSLQTEFPPATLQRSGFPGEGPATLNGEDIHNDEDVKMFLTPRGQDGGSSWDSTLPGYYTGYLFYEEHVVESVEQRLEELRVAAFMERQQLAGLRKLLPVLLNESLKAKDYGTWKMFMRVSWSIQPQTERGGSTTGGSTTNASLKAEVAALKEQIAALTVTNEDLQQAKVEVDRELITLKGEYRDLEGEYCEAKKWYLGDQYAADEEIKESKRRVEDAQAQLADAYERVRRNSEANVEREREFRASESALRAELAESRKETKKFKDAYMQNSSNFHLACEIASLRQKIQRKEREEAKEAALNTIETTTPETTTLPTIASTLP